MAEPLGVGVATLWTGGRPDFDPRWRRVSGGLAVAHAVARRLVTPPGRLPWAPEVGLDITALLNDGLTTGRVRTLASYIRRECLGDDRVKDATVTADLVGTRLTIRVELTTSDAETFALVLGASKLTAEILAIEKV